MTGEDEKQELPKVTAIPAPQDQLIVTKHTLKLDGQEIPYTATCGTMVLKEETLKKGEEAGQAEGEKARASIFFIAYTLDQVEDVSRRPIAFTFNGGPGSSSVWLHLGMLGPKRVEMGDVGNVLPPPYRLVDNPYSLLDQTDLVFIDPVSTGYSRAVPGEKPKDFHDFKKDIESVGDFIRLYTSRYQRWTSPKYLVGESYGTTRAAGLSGYLQERHGMYLNGLVLVSAVLNFQTLEFGTGNELPYLLYLPAYTATAWYHNRLPGSLQKKGLQAALEEAETFVFDEYNRALLKGDALTDLERSSIVHKLALFTGLSEAYIERTNLRPEIMRFTKELLREQRRTIGRLDSRFTGIDRDAAGEHFEHDPSSSATRGPYTAAFNQYVRAELGYESDLPYEVIKDLWQDWSYTDHNNKFVDVAETLRKAISTNPALRVFVANGYYDLATPYFASVYTFNHLALDPALRSNIVLRYYEAGHMMYVHLPSLEKLKGDLVEFMRQGSSG
jgi:carboxypeptidase C (cathepsin A)